jgi:hypothetical protein
MSGFIQYEQQMMIRGADGSLLWVGTCAMGVPYLVTLDTAAPAAANLGDAVRFNTTDSVIPILETTAAGASPLAILPQTAQFRVFRVASATDTNFVGVLLEPVAIGKRGLCAGIGSITTVNCTATTIAAGALMGGSATAGLVAALATPTLTIGQCFKTNTVSVPAGTGSTGKAGLLVNPR